MPTNEEKKLQKYITKIKAKCNATNCTGTRDWRGELAEIRAIRIEGTQNATKGRKRKTRKSVYTKKGVCDFSAEKSLRKLNLKNNKILVDGINCLYLVFAQKFAWILLFHAKLLYFKYLLSIIYII